MNCKHEWVVFSCALDNWEQPARILTENPLHKFASIIYDIIAPNMTKIP